MLFKKSGVWEIEKNSKFSERVLVLSVPSAIVFMLLVVLQFLSPLSAVLSYGAIVIFNMIFLSPISIELQRLKKYINNLAQGNLEKEVDLSKTEAREIADAINSMHRFWVAKTDALEAKAMSDAAVLDTLPDPILMIDRSGNILGANYSARKLLGDNIADKNIENVFDSNNFIEAVSKVLKKESEAENLAFYAAAPLDKKIYAHIKQLPWFSKGRAVAVVSLYDLTKAMTVEKMQSDFVANASHELRTPLSVISGFIETLQTTAKDDENAREQFLNIMKEQASFMSSLIENLLSLSKIAMSQDELPTEKTDIINVVENVAQALEMKAKDRSMNIKIEKPARLKKIIADSGQIKQLVQNLTDNAIKYGLMNSDVTIKIKEVEKIPNSKTFNVAQGKAVCIAINNKGPKISPQDLARLTERFYRLQEHKNLGIKGTGLGLSIAKQIMMRHKGNLTVSSTAHNGTTFTVYLPMELKN
ncbi:MAG: PAS domain-containing protein [Alphaproteobacteria bacterium]|nr:PAS domain-containing protein [Alphaproteobacteria bacterium]